MKDFFYAIQDLFVNTLFAPFDALRELELTSWFSANIMSWVFMAIGSVAFIYWMLELKKYNDNNEEDKSVSAHSYL
ncbi:MAG: uracil phosphoribosyltransferase [Winogradskyella sp.]|nr:MAG: uracil phosphoribosyltransferase [Winogradskyella sp.]